MRKNHEKPLPLQILQQREQKQNKIINTPNNALASAFDIGNNPDDLINLDQFLSWILGSTFCKRKYNGAYSDINQQLLSIYDANAKKGQSYKDCRMEFRSNLCFGVLIECWSKYKQIYRLDNDFLTELMRTKKIKKDIQIPVEVLKRLPIRCFYLDLENRPEFDPISGSFVYVGFDNINGQPSLCVYHAHQPENDNCDIRPGIYMDAREMEKHGLLRTEEKDGKTETFIQFHVDHTQIADKELTLLILQTILYLSSNKPDITENQRIQHTKQASHPMPDTDAKDNNTKDTDTNEITINDIGVRYGAAIRKIKKAKPTRNTTTDNAKPAPAKPRRPMSSHIRAAHWHTYWIGKGRTEKILKWVPPTFVTGTGKELPITIRKIKK